MEAVTGNENKVTGFQQKKFISDEVSGPSLRQIVKFVLVVKVRVRHLQLLPMDLTVKKVNVIGALGLHSESPSFLYYMTRPHICKQDFLVFYAAFALSCIYILIRALWYADSF